MPQKNIDRHGSAPDKHKFALLLIDVINDFDFPEADQLLKYARPMARNLLRLKRRAQKAGVPVVYVNDNFGRWKSDFVFFSQQTMPIYAISTCLCLRIARYRIQRRKMTLHLRS